MHVLYPKGFYRNSTSYHKNNTVFMTLLRADNLKHKTSSYIWKHCDNTMYFFLLLWCIVTWFTCLICCKGQWLNPNVKKWFVSTGIPCKFKWPILMHILCISSYLFRLTRLWEFTNFWTIYLCKTKICKIKQLLLLSKLDQKIKSR